MIVVVIARNRIHIILFIYQFDCLSIHLSIYLTIYPPIYLGGMDDSSSDSEDEDPHYFMLRKRKPATNFTPGKKYIFINVVTIGAIFSNPAE